VPCWEFERYVTMVRAKGNALRAEPERWGRKRGFRASRQRTQSSRPAGVSYRSHVPSRVFIIGFVKIVPETCLGDLAAWRDGRGKNRRTERDTFPTPAGVRVTRIRTFVGRGAGYSFRALVRSLRISSRYY